MKTTTQEKTIHSIHSPDNQDSQVSVVVKNHENKPSKSMISAPQYRMSPNIRNLLDVMTGQTMANSRFGDGDKFLTNEGMEVYKHLTGYQEPLILQDARAVIHQTQTIEQFKNYFLAKFASKNKRKSNIVRGLPQMNLGITPNKTMVSRGIINASTPDCDIYTDLDDFYMTFIGGQPGTGKSVFLNQLMYQVRNLIMVAIAKGKYAVPDDFVGILITDPKNELQEMAIKIFHGLRVLKQNGEEVDLLRIISPVEVQLQLKVEDENGNEIEITKTILPTNVNLVGDLPINVTNEKFWTFLKNLAGTGGNQDPFWDNAGNQMFESFGFVTHYCLKALNMPRSTYRLYIEYNSIEKLTALLKQANDAVLNKSPLEQTLFFYDLLETYEHRSKQMAHTNGYYDHADAANSMMELTQLKAEIRPKIKLEVEAYARKNGLTLSQSELTELIEERMKTVIEKAKQQNHDAFAESYDISHTVKLALARYKQNISDGTVEGMFNQEQLAVVYERAMNNKAAFEKAIDYFADQYATMDDKLKSNIFMTLMTTLKPILSNPAVMPWLTCEDGVTGADACSGQFMALYINRDEQPQFYDFATRMVKSQMYDALRKRTATWRDPVANKNKGITPFQTRVIEIADEEYLSIGDGQLEMSIMSILRSLGLSRWVATQFKEQYDEKMGGGSNLNTANAANYLSMFNNVVLFKTSTETYEFFSKLWGTHPQNYMCISNDEVASGINFDAIRNTRKMGLGGVYSNFYERNITMEFDKDSTGQSYQYMKPRERGINVLPTGAMNIIDAPIFQIGKGEKESLTDMTAHLDRPFACITKIRQGGVEQFGLGLLTPYFAMEKRDRERLAFLNSL